MTTSRAVDDDESCSIRRRMISLRAFEKWAARGRPADTSLLDWLEAESELHQIEVLSRQVYELELRFFDQMAAIRQSQRFLLVEHDVARTLSVASSLEEAAPRILKSVCESLGYAVGVLWVIDHEAAVLRCAEIYELSMLDVTEFTKLSRTQTFARGVGLPGRVWANQMPMSLPDVAADRSLPRSGAAASTDLHGAIAFPVRNGVEFLGVMEFYGHAVGEPDEALVEMMASIGSQISQFIERRNAEAAIRREQEERRLAGRIQQRLLPCEKPDVAGYDISGRCLSAFDVGGDCFDFLPITNNGDECLGVLVGDASGHGLGAALLVAETRAYIRALALNCADVGRLLKFVNRRITDDLEREGFVTAMLLRLVPGDGSLVYANAGHCAGLLFDRHGQVREQLTSTGFPLGIDPGARFSRRTARLGTGELILLFSDGAIEACSPAGELYGIQRLCRAVETHWDTSVDALLEAVFGDVNRFQNGSGVRDDITVVVIKRLDPNQEPKDDALPFGSLRRGSFLSGIKDLP